jgi:putative hemolysin
VTELSSASAAAALRYPVHAQSIPIDQASAGRYRLRFARDRDELERILRLRFEVFNLELGEGLARSFATGRDEDHFDATCHHLLVEHDDGTGERASIIGTYRMQTLEMAEEGCGFYCAGEYDLAAIPRVVLEQSIETGRACIHHDHRNKQVLYLLWRGLAYYITAARKRYYFGCSSLTSTDPDQGVRLYRQLRAAGSVHPDIFVEALPDFRCAARREDLLAAPAPADPEIHVPTLFRTYLRHGAQIMGAPAIDREFGTVDFLILVDLERLAPKSREMFFTG